MKKKETILKYQLPIYNVDLVLYIGDKERFSDYTKSKYHITYESFDGQGGYYESVGDMPDVIYLPKFNGKMLDILTLTHELMHFTFHALGNAGITLDRNSEEAFAYAMTEIQEQVLTDLLKLKQ
jgi:Zn-dependent peptidase ImmA (M78 family)